MLPNTKPQLAPGNVNHALYTAPSMHSESFTNLLSPCTNVMMPSHSFSSTLPDTNYSEAMAMAMNGFPALHASERMHVPQRRMSKPFPQGINSQSTREHANTNMDASLLQASLEHPKAPNLLKQYHLEWNHQHTKRQECDRAPIHSIESQLLSLMDKDCCLQSMHCIDPFLALIQSSTTETDQAYLLLILRATTQRAYSITMEHKRLAKSLARGFEKQGGLCLIKSWIENAVDSHSRDLLVLILDVLCHLPLRLSSITQAKINEPIMKLKKNARDEIVKKSAQELLKIWRSRFTENEKAKEAVIAARKSGTQTKSHTIAPTKSHTKAAIPHESHTKDNSKKRTVKIKCLDHLPFGGASLISKTSSDLIDNLKQRNAAKDAAIAQSDSKKVALSDTNCKEEQEMAMQLPAIQSFGAVINTVSKKIRWADEQGAELVQVQFIESWRDLVSTKGMNSDQSFLNAKLREHADERNALKSQKQNFVIQPTHEWYTPPLVQFPEAIAARKEAVSTEECAAQTARTRHEMEYVVLPGEVPQASPKESGNGNEDLESSRTFEIPLFEVPQDNHSADHEAERGMEEDDRDYGEELEEEAALRDALGPLKRSTIALLIENEDVLPQVCEEAQRNGNLISDERIHEIIANRHSWNNGYPPPPPSFRGYVPPLPPHHAPPMPHMQRPFQDHPPHFPMKRKLGQMHPGMLPNAMPPPKRLMRKGPASLPCMYYHQSNGCKHGNACQYAHAVATGGNMQGNPHFNEFYNANIPNPMHHTEPFVSDSVRMGMRGNSPPYRPRR